MFVFDSASKALSTAGLNENSPPEVTRWTVEILLPLRDLGATVLVIDHVAKSATSTTPYPRGSGSKLADSENAWYVEKTEPFNREKSGEVKLTCKKNRSGTLPGEVRLKVGDGRGGLPVESLDAGAAASGTAATNGDGRRTALRQRLLDCLRNHEGSELTGAQVRQMVSGRTADITHMLSEIVDDPTAPVNARPGPRNSVLYRYDPGAVVPLARNRLPV